MFKRRAIEAATIAIALGGMIAFTSTPSHAILGDQVLKSGMVHKDVQVLQQELKDRGFFTYKNVTLYFGSITKSALMEFQSSENIVPSGIFDKVTYEALQSSKTVESSAKTDSTNKVLTLNRELSFRMKGEDVRLAQEALKSLNYLVIGNCTDYFGTMTRSSLIAFQKANNLNPDGILGPRSLDGINKALSGRGIDLPSPSRGTETDSTSRVTETDSTKKVLTLNRELSFQMKGEDVRLAQEALKSLNYLVIGNCTDYFGTMTRSSLIAFQKANNLNPDGILGPRSLDGINKALSGRGIDLPSPSRGVEVGTLSAKLAATAKQYLGHRYIYGGASPSGFDCSGFTSYVYKQHGITLPRTSTSQAYVGTKLNKANLLPGDLLIFSNTYKSGPSHTGIYLGNGQFIHASTATTGVIISDLNSTYYAKHFSYGRRLY